MLMGLCLQEVLSIEKASSRRRNPMPETKLCPACEMPFDWPGVSEDSEEFCCEDCARNLPCTCPQHDHRSESSSEPAEQVAV
jgi:hypothetical protein